MFDSEDSHTCTQKQSPILKIARGRETEAEEEKERRKIEFWINKRIYLRPKLYV